jgi:hypothetical protein
MASENKELKIYSEERVIIPDRANSSGSMFDVVGIRWVLHEFFTSTAPAD